MDRQFQRATFVDQLCAHGGDFPTAYAALCEQAGGAVVPEEEALTWAREVPDGQLSDGARAALVRFLNDEPTPSAALILDEGVTGKAMLARMEIGAMRVVEDVFLDVGRRTPKYSDKVRAGTAMKFLELMGTPLRHSGGASSGQRGHQQVSPDAGAFGRVTDREALITYVEQHSSVDRLTARLRVKDPTLIGLEEEHVRRVLVNWQRNGIVLDPQSGEVVEWEAALAWARQAIGLYDAPGGALGP